MLVEGDLWVKIGNRKVPTGFTTKTWDNLVDGYKMGIVYAQILLDSDLDIGEGMLSDIYHYINNGKIELGLIGEDK